MTTEDTRALVLRMLQDAGATGDVAGAVRNLAGPQFVVHLSTGEVGGIELGSATAQELYLSVPDASLTLEGMIVENDRAALQFQLSGTNTGPVRGYPATGKPVSIPFCLGLRVEGNAIAEIWFYLNSFAPIIPTYAESHPDEPV